jgi:hypothetical protein
MTPSGTILYLVLNKLNESENLHRFEQIRKAAKALTLLNKPEDAPERAAHWRTIKRFADSEFGGDPDFFKWATDALKTEGEDANA